jgi:hypothetical protein
MANGQRGVGSAASRGRFLGFWRRGRGSCARMAAARSCADRVQGAGRLLVHGAASGWARGSAGRGRWTGQLLGRVAGSPGVGGSRGGARSAWLRGQREQGREERRRWEREVGWRRLAVREGEDRLGEERGAMGPTWK